ncbi:hypothetical protein [Pelovirga terrestris]|uniref:Uncharacterized protein n=1 Tax=Pelovirga terrestris TaxID=2771352 RepID=A0A8J6QNH7_9BACT|nr:hypothetical protein [Pelovirga terrestris]MBD1400882.1 hypothetical protein [Pelovirga terrestris]
MSKQEIGLENLLEATGRSFEAAQHDLGLPVGMQTRMMFEDAELEIKVQGVGVDGRGRLNMSPVSLAGLAGNELMAGALSTIRVHYVAARPDVPPAASSRTREEILAEVAERKDIRKLREILGDMTYQVTFQPEVKAWTVRVADNKDRTVRILAINDNNP